MIEEYNQRVQSFLQAQGMSEGYFGRLVNNDSYMVKRLREGRITLKTLNKAMEFIDSYKPKRGKGKK